jgi:serine/threonine-protein kinase RsbW
MNKASIKYNNNNQLTAVSDLSELKKIRDFVRAHAFAFGFNDDESQKIALAVDEACTNLIRHAFNYDRNKSFSVIIEKNSNQFIVVITDNGLAFNPLSVPQPDMNEYMKKYRRGGLGIFIMRNVMDEISYSPSNENNPQNVLKLKKYLH